VNKDVVRLANHFKIQGNADKCESLSWFNGITDFDVVDGTLALPWRQAKHPYLQREHFSLFFGHQF
jgi:hypothetical protein